MITTDLLQTAKFTKVADSVSAGTSAVNGSALDMTGYLGVVFLTSYGTAASNNTITGQMADDSTGTFEDLTGTAVTVSTSDEDVVLQVIKPTKRYVRVASARGTSTTQGDIWAVQFGARSIPVTNTVAGTLRAETHLSPSTGTA